MPQKIYVCTLCTMKKAHFCSTTFAYLIPRRKCIETKKTTTLTHTRIKKVDISDVLVKQALDCNRLHIHARVYVCDLNVRNEDFHILDAVYTHDAAGYHTQDSLITVVVHPEEEYRYHYSRLRIVC